MTGQMLYAPYFKANPSYVEFAAEAAHVVEVPNVANSIQVWQTFRDDWSINSTAVFIFRQFFLGLPQELFDAARIDGASELHVLTRVALPLVRPALLTAMLLTFIGPWNEFL